jgi:hypothetical protein
MISIIGMKETGVTYESFTSLIPFSVFACMVYDVIREKNKFYFTPVYEKRKFGKNMYVFSLKHILHTQTKKLIFKVEKTKLGGKVIGWIRKKV